MNTHLFTLQDINWWSHVDYLWIIVMILSAVRTLNLMAPIHCKDPLMSKWCKISPNRFRWRNKLIYILDCQRVSIFSAFFIIYFPFGESYIKYIIKTCIWCIFFCCFNVCLILKCNAKCINVNVSCSKGEIQLSSRFKALSQTCGPHYQFFTGLFPCVLFFTSSEKH